MSSTHPWYTFCPTPGGTSTIMGEVYLHTQSILEPFYGVLRSSVSRNLCLQVSIYQALMAKTLPFVCSLLFLLFSLVVDGDAYGQSGAFTIDNISTSDVSDCNTADGVITIRINSSNSGTSPYDISLDNGTTWIANDLAPNGSGDISIPGQFWGAYAVAIRDANDDIVYPGYAQIEGCVYDACSPSSDNFTIGAVTGATGYDWTTTVGSIASGNNTTSVELDLSALSPGTTGTVCVQPTGDACTAPQTCFGIRILCPEICNDGIDNDLDGDTDCDDGDCANPVANAGGNQAICNGASASLNAVASGGAPGYTYSWDNGLGAGASHVVSPAITTTYTVTVTDLNGCTATDNVVVTVHTLPSGTITSTNSACGVSTGTISVTTPNFPSRPGIQYSIDNGVSYSAAVTPDGTDFDFTGLAAGSYNIWARWSNGDCPVSLGSETVGTNSGPSASIAPVSEVCAGNNITLNASQVGGVGPYSYTWTGGLTAVANPTFTPPSNPLSDRTTTYTVTVEDANGCVDTESIDVTVFSSPIAIVTHDDENCGQGNGAITFSFSDNADRTAMQFSTDGGSTYSSAVSDNAGSYTVSGLSSGFYEMSVRWDGGDCPTVLGDVILLDTAPPTVDAGSDDAICAGNSITITALGAGGAGGYTYSWDNGLGAGASHSVSPGVATTYTVTVTDTDGCTNTDQVVIDVYTLPSGTITHSNTACGTNIGSITITTPNFPSRPGIQYSIDGGSSYSPSITPDGGTYTFSNLAAGTYSVYARWDNGDCPVELGDETVGTNGGPSSSIASIAEVCAGETAQLTVTTIGGVPPYTYSWTNGLSAVANPTFTPPAAPTSDRVTSYTVTVEDVFGCTTTATQTVTVRARPFVTLASDPENCGQTDGQISATIIDNPDETTVRISVDGGSTYGSPINDNVGTHNITGLSAGTYNVFAQWGDGSCPVDLGNVTFANRAAPVAAAGGDQTICPGATATIVGSSTGDFGTMTYTWDNGLGVGATQTVSPAVTTTYTLTASNSFGCSSTDQVTITVQDNTDPVLVGVPGNVVVECNAIPVAPTVTATDDCGSATVTPSETVTAGTCTYDYTITRVWTADDGNGNTATASQIITVEDNSLPTFTTVPADITIECGTATPSSMATATDVCGAAVVTVANTPGPASCAGNAIIRTFTATDACGNTATTSQVVTIQDVTPPVLSSMPADVSVTPTTIPPVPAITASDVCDASVTPVYNQVKIGTGCSYTLERTWTATDDCLNSTAYTQVISVSNSLNAGASVTSNYNGSDIRCPLSSDGEVTAVATNGAPPYSYLWDDGTTTAVNTGLAAGTYTVTIRDSEGCEATASASVVAPAALSVVPTINDVSCNGNNDGQISLAISGGAGPYNVSWSSGQSTATIGSLTAGSYIYTVTDQNGCSATASLDVDQPTLLGASITVETSYPGGTAISCNGENDATLEAFGTGGTPPYTYTWSNSQTTKIITGIGAGPVSVTIVDAEGCTQIANANVAEPALLAANITAVTDYDGFGVSCATESDGSIRVNATGGTAPYSYLWSSGVVTAQADNLAAGTHSVSVTDANGCTESSSFTITAPPVVTANAFVSSDYNSRDVSCFNISDGAVSVTPGGGTAPYTYEWSTGDLTQSVSGLFPGTYSVTVADRYDCRATSSVTITNTPELTVSPSLSVTYDTYGVSCNGGSDGELASNAAGGTPPYTYSWTGGQTTSTATNVSAGNYFVTVTDANGCTATNSIIVTEPPSFSFTTSSNPPTDCGIDDGIILVNASGGTSDFQYSIDGTTWQSSNSFTGLSSGNYPVYVRTEFGTCVQGPISENVQVASSPTIDGVTIVNPQTNVSGDGGILVEASGNGVQLEYELQGVAGWQTSDLFENLSPGTYTIRVRYQGQNCIATRTVTLTAGGGVVGNVNLNSCSDELSETSFIEVYYIPFQEDQILTTLEKHYPVDCPEVRPLPQDPISTYVSIGVAESGTIIHFDHWEDGFEPNLGFPIQGTTEIWGDGDPSNGIAPGYSVDYFAAGNIIVLDNDVVSTTRASVIDFDGGDKIGSRGYLSITRLGWASNTDTYLAGALEVLPTYDWGTSFTFPVGMTAAWDDPFDYSSGIIMAQEDNTSVTIYNNGSTSTISLDEGESYQIQGGYDFGFTNRVGIVAGDRVVADKPIQVHMITGFVCGGYESRWFTLRPDTDWSNEYFNPITTGATASTKIWIYNPASSGLLPVRLEYQSGTLSLSVPAGQSRAFDMPLNSGARIYSTDGSDFYALATIDSDNFTNPPTVPQARTGSDWGYALVPRTKLSQQIGIVGFAPGKNPNDLVDPNNSSPIWITPYSSTVPTVTVCIDYNGDGGANVDANGVYYDRQEILSNLASLKQVFRMI